MKKFTLNGIVQGIGFRPNVKRAADELNITGYVKNLGGSVEILAGGKKTEEFKNAVLNMPQSLITSFYEEDCDDEYFDDFKIIESGSEIKSVPVITPDIATCGKCMNEFYEPKNRRYMHPFISCIHCGPRYSIISEIPYDRENIVMSEFEMCADCKREYTSVSDVRCFAQTIACNSCGPVLSYTKEGNPLVEAKKTLLSGGIAAIKDIGGYHLACMAGAEDAVKKLRDIKKREKKPFAVMFNSIKHIREYADVNELEEKTIKSAVRPIVLVEKKKDFAPSVSADSDYIGAFLPCNPVQDYLTKECGALVMTSANLTGETIITDDDEIHKLRKSSPCFEILSHNRRILTPLDDSVCRIICGRVQLIRRARGFVPLPVDISIKSKTTALALGGDLKASFCYAKDGRAYMSQYFGDLSDARAYSAWEKNIERLGGLLDLKADIAIMDAHPLYISAQYRDGNKMQHHFAHFASVIAEHKINAAALGFIFDGTGYGSDGNIWGGEVISYNGEFTRTAHLEYTPILGGDTSAKNSGQTLDCYLIAAGLEPMSENAAMIKAAVKNNINTVKSSSMGRLFDAVSALLGISKYNSYEGESAILLEKAANKAAEPYPLKLNMKNGIWQTSRLISDIYAALKDLADINALALGFHHAIANAVIEYAEIYGEKNIILSGGVFANAILTKLCINSLEDKGFNVYINEQVPPNDGGIALGQAWWSLKENENVCSSTGKNNKIGRQNSND